MITWKYNHTLIGITYNYWYVFQWQTLMFAHACFVITHYKCVCLFLYILNNAYILLNACFICFKFNSQGTADWNEATGDNLGLLQLLFLHIQCPPLIKTAIKLQFSRSSVLGHVHNNHTSLPPETELQTHQLTIAIFKTCAACFYE